MFQLLRLFPNLSVRLLRLIRKRFFFIFPSCDFDDARILYQIEQTDLKIEIYIYAYEN